MKINWGTGIAAVYIGFLVVVFGTIAFTLTVDVNLVTENYYEEELKHQIQIDKVNRTKALPSQPGIEMRSDSLLFTFPKMFRSSQILGNINFYRPNKEEMDFNLDIKLDPDNSQYFDLSTIAPGRWNINVDWSVYSVEYFHQTKIDIE